MAFFCTGLILINLSEDLCLLIYVFSWFCFIQSLASFSSIDHRLALCAHLLILFHLTKIRFYQFTFLLIHATLETLTLVNQSSAGKLIYNFYNFPTQILNYDFHGSAFLDLFMSSDPSFFSFSL